MTALPTLAEFKVRIAKRRAHDRKVERKLRRLVERTLLIETDPLARADLKAHADRVLGQRRRPVARTLSLPMATDAPAEIVADGEASERAPPETKTALSAGTERRGLIKVFASLNPTRTAPPAQPRFDPAPLPDALWFAQHPTRRFRVRQLIATACEACLVVVVERTPEGYLDRHFRRPDDLIYCETDDQIARALALPPSIAMGDIRWLP